MLRRRFALSSPPRGKDPIEKPVMGSQAEKEAGGGEGGENVAFQGRNAARGSLSEERKETICRIHEAAACIHLSSYKMTSLILDIFPPLQAGCCAVRAVGQVSRVGSESPASQPYRILEQCSTAARLICDHK